jgi:2'-5' RNA ligase
MAATVRAFLAVPLPAPLRRKIAAVQAELSAPLRAIRWTAPETIHLTLRFFGDTGSDDLEKIRTSMLSVTLRERPCQVALQGLGAFPGRHRPRVVWIGLAPTEPLLALHQDCEAALARNGFPRESRPFVPHLTIGRFRERGPDLGDLLAARENLIFGRLPVETLVLYESRLRPEGARHTPLFTVPLS